LNNWREAEKFKKTKAEFLEVIEKFKKTILKTGSSTILLHIHGILQSVQCECARKSIDVALSIVR
jgi:hypothetical protein